MKTALIGGGLGFIGHHMARRLKAEGYWIRVVDIESYKYGDIDFADDVVIGDLKDIQLVKSVLKVEYYPGNDIPLNWTYHSKPFTTTSQFNEIYNFACLMGGAGFVFTGENDSEIMQSARINLNFCECLKDYKGKFFYSSSACMYPQEIQNGKFNPKEQTVMNYLSERKSVALAESDAYPANPDSEYGWEKLFSERLYLAYQRNYNLNVRIARFHNIYGPEGTYTGGKEKAPAAMCRKVIEASINDKTEIEVWGDGQQTRSFLYIDDCIDAVRLLMESDFKEPINIGSEEMVSINQLAQMAIGILRYGATVKNVHSNALGVRGRNSDNTLIRKVLNWQPKYSLRDGLTKTLKWIKDEINGLHTK